MTYAPFPINDFGGLDLVSEADEAGCVDLLNVDFDKRGAVRSRDGYTKLNAAANASTFANSGPFVWNAQNRVICSAANDRTYVYSAAGTLLYTSGVYSGQPAGQNAVLSVAEFGTGTTSYLYLTMPGTQTIRLTTGGTFSSPAGMPDCYYLAVQPSENRLVAGAINTTQYRVRFSDRGDAETWGANNYVDLHPNDGQIVTGMAAWSNQLFVFKARKFFVFYGNSVDATGQPVFNYRTVDTGVGVDAQSGVVVAPDGVYFIAADGIYKTTGGPPVKISAALDPLFSGAGTPFCQVTPPLAYAVFAGAAYRKGRVYFTVDDSGAANRYTLVYDIASASWFIWQMGHKPVGGMALFPLSATDERIVFASGTRLYTFGVADTSDDGTAITSRYRSGFMALNYIRRSGHWYPIASQEADVRETVLDGTGTINYSLSRDFGAIPTTGGGARTSVTLGTAPALAQGRHRIAQRGRRVSYQIASTTPWRVEGLTLHLRGAGRGPGLETSE